MRSGGAGTEAFSLSRILMMLFCVELIKLLDIATYAMMKSFSK
jgi:hypothetical protein